MSRFCFFHAGCPDGFGAAWATWRAWGDDARYVPRGHDDAFEPARYRGAVVAFVDIAPPPRSLARLGEAAKELIVLDHHVSARDRFTEQPDLARALAARGHRVHFDLEHSGAILAWEHFHRDEAPPDLLLYVEDQDLWHWKLPYSEQVNAAIGSYPRDFETWQQLAARPAEELAEEGEPIVRSNHHEIERALLSAHPVRLGEQRIEAVNSSSLRAPIGHELAKRAAFGQAWGLVYRVQGSRVDASIYSIGSLDVSRVAEGYGGGGHRNASGFTVSLEEWYRSFA